MNTLGFDDYIEPLKVYLAKYRASVKGGKNAEMDTSGESDRREDNAPSSEHTSVAYQGGGGSSGGGGGGGSALGDFEDMEDDF